MGSKIDPGGSKWVPEVPKGHGGPKWVPGFPNESQRFQIVQGFPNKSGGSQIVQGVLNSSGVPNNKCGAFRMRIRGYKIKGARIKYRFENIFFFLTWWFEIILVIFCPGSGLDLHWPNFVDPDPHTINADPHHWLKGSETGGLLNN